MVRSGPLLPRREVPGLCLARQQPLRLLGERRGRLHSLQIIREAQLVHHGLRLVRGLHLHPHGLRRLREALL